MEIDRSGPSLDQAEYSTSGQAMHLYRILYYSRLVGNAEIEAILETARERNRQDYITGALWFDGEFFIQVLEGGRVKLTETYNRIACDPRHKNIVLAQCVPIFERSYSDWSMAFYADTRENRNRIKRYVAQDFLDPRPMPPESMLKLLSDGELA
jgi:hypothetical protein